MSIKAKEQKNKLKFTDNKPLIGAVLTGVFYFFTLSDLFMPESKWGIFAVIYFPGITFPLATSYFNTQHLKNRAVFILCHFIFSILLYFGCIVLFFVDSETGVSSIFAGLLGSFVYLAVTTRLHKEINEKQLLIAAVLSGLAFLPLILSVMIDARGLLRAYPIGFGVFAWTVINGYVLNSAYKKSISRGS